MNSAFRLLTKVGSIAVVAIVAAATIPSRTFRDRHVQESVVAGSPHDFMIVRHLKISGTNEQIGAELAKIAVSRHGYKPGFADLALANKRRVWFETSFPVIAERATGVKDVLKTSNLDPFDLSYDLLNQPGCSTVFYPGPFTWNNHPILSRNYDFSTKTYAEMTGRESGPKDRAFTADPYILELHPTKGYATLAVVSYDLLMGCVDGMNDKGLTVALLADDISRGAKPTHGAQPGLGEIEIPRFLLETCVTVDDAIKATKDLRRYYSFIPCHYIVGDANGNSCVIEWSIPENKWSAVKGDGKPQIVTNHLVSQFPNRASFPDDPRPSGSFNRFCRMQDQVSGVDGELGLDQIKAINQSVAAGPSISRDPKNGRTLWHSVYDLKAKTLEVSFYLGESTDGTGHVRKSPYLTFKL
ncbi:MAG: C45 family peptidase [Armatimonadota bacterium]